MEDEMNTAITMTPEQTAVYDDGREIEQRKLMADLRRQARDIGGVVEIYTSDGIVADIVQ